MIGVAAIAAGLTGALLALWGVQRLTGNASWADAGWAAGIGVVVLLGLATSEIDPWRQTAAMLLVGAWATRLTWHLVRRSLQAQEDGRFADMRQRWGDRAQRNFLRYFLAQVPLVLVFCLPAMALDGDVRAPGWRDAVGVGIGVTGLLGGAIADRQLLRHRASVAESEICNRGLWRYSRHPNYFFEWVTWCAWPLLAPATATGSLALVPPVLLFVLLTRVTGIPPAEARALQRRGDAYRRYQAVTSSFIPWPPATDSSKRYQRM
jgi:steroid 5-alpha reductase family enzyme